MYAPPREFFLVFRPHNMISETVLGHLKQFVNTVQRLGCCNIVCVCVLQLG